MKFSYKIFTAMLLLSLFCTGCVKLNRPPLDRKYYVVSVAGNATQVKGGDKTLVVRRFQISPRYQDNELVYRTGKAAYTADYYNSFFVPPAEMMTEELRRWFAGSGLFKNVIAPSSLASGGLILEGMINSLYGDYQDAHPAAVVEMQFFLIDNRKENTPIIYSRTFKEKIRLNSKNGEELVEGMSKGVENIFSALEKDLSELEDVKN